ncbi:M48 family metallopeptidase [Lysobacter soyae]|uniref:M48 family metallopeptidase n=1 Tax=Lysobacter soyae TaxID=2764185 RepID=A0ABX8WRH3_9GAMM|nr:M48 family metallopeptidase [Lysobacter sp. CJ11]QYR53433.1 M48 family metallopeptidase [Lysobacter sp. CJ11]
MNFFEHQAAARSRSRRLIFLFVLAVLGVVFAVDACVLLLTARSGDGASLAATLVWPTLLTLAVIGLASLYKVTALKSGGGEEVARGLGGVPVAENTADPKLMRLRNVVEEMSIASGVPMPKLYVLEEDAGINAFAAGYSPADAVVAVTRGALDRLNRDELQGVIAHEFSHVLNGDMRINIRLIGVLFGIMVISLIGRKVLFHGASFSGGSRRSNGMGMALVIGIAALVIGSVGMFFARMIKAGVSRQREALADASAVQFTRQTQGLAGALKKIAGLDAGSTLARKAEAEEVSHMLFGNGLGFSGLFATHPPILERIKTLEPSFGTAQLDGLKQQWRQRPPNGMEEDRQLGIAGSVPAARDLSSPVDVLPASVSGQVGHPGLDDYARADVILAEMPEVLRELARDREQVRPLLASLLLGNEEDQLEARHALVAHYMDEADAESTWRIHTQLVADLHPALRLPLAMLAFPTLRQFPRPDIENFIEMADALIHADARVTLFEYCLGILLQKQVREALDPGNHAQMGRLKTQGVKDEFITLLRVVAHAGARDQQEAQRAFQAGLANVVQREVIEYVPPADDYAQLDSIWPRLDALDPLAKQVVVESMTAAIGFDGRVTIAEAELLRTLCAVLHCPLPPMLNRQP